MRYFRFCLASILIAVMLALAAGCSEKKPPDDPESRKRAIEEFKNTRKKEWGY